MVDGDTKTLREYGNDMRTLATKSERIWWSMGDDSSILCADINIAVTFSFNPFFCGEVLDAISKLNVLHVHFFFTQGVLTLGNSQTIPFCDTDGVLHFFYKYVTHPLPSDRKWDPRQLDRVDNKTHAQKSSIIMPWWSELHLCSGFSQCPIYFWPASVLELIYPWLRNLLCKDWILD